MDKVKGYEVLIEVVKNNKTHQDYKRVVDLADLYYKLTTGDKISDLLKQIITRESDEEFKQRVKISESVCPAILNSTKLPFQKATRKPPIVREIDFAVNADDKKLELEQFIKTYWGDKSLEQYLEYAFTDYNYIDPNAFLITEFSAFDSRIEKAKPYPFIVSSSEAIMFEYHNEILDYLIVKLPITFLDKKVSRPGFKFTMYLGKDTIEFTQVSEDEKGNEGVVLIEGKEKAYYLIAYFIPGYIKVPAIRLGFIRDAETKGRSFVSVFHHVLAYLKKTFKIDSELDLSTSMCAFQQRFAYVSPCKNPACNKGRLLDNTLCPDCNGTGEQPFHRGTMDIVTLTLPKDPADIIDLERLMVYKGPLIELLTFQKDYIEYLKQSVHAMMFNADLFTRDQVAITATEKILDTDNMNDTLYPFLRHLSSVWEFIVRDIATVTDLNKPEDKLKVQNKYPYDLKMKGLLELMTELKASKDAGASTSTISAIEDDINEILYSDRPEELKEMRIKNEINPFRGVANADIRFIISQNNVPLYNRTLWENFESIFQDLEIENQNPWLYDLNTIVINEKVKAKTQEYINNISGEADAQAKKDAANYQQPFTGGQ